MKKPTRKPSRWCFFAPNHVTSSPPDNSLDELFDSVPDELQDFHIGEAKRVPFSRIVTATEFRPIADRVLEDLQSTLEEIVGDEAAEAALDPSNKDLDLLADTISKAVERWLRTTQKSLGCFEVENIRHVMISESIYPEYATIAMKTKES